MNPIEPEIFEKETVIDALQFYQTKNNLFIPDKQIKNLKSEDFKIIYEGTKCQILGNRNIASKPLIFKVFKKDFEVFPGFVQLEVINTFMQPYDLQSYFLRFKTHELSSKDLDIIGGKLNDQVLKTQGQDGEDQGINPSYISHILPNLHQAPDENQSTFVFEFLPGGKDKISYYNIQQLKTLAKSSKMEKLDAAFFKTLNETQNPEEILHQNVAPHDIQNAFKKLIKHPLGNFKIQENGVQMYQENNNQFRDEARKETIDNIVDFISNDPEFIELLKNLAKFQDDHVFNFDEIKKCFEENRFGFLPSFKEMFTMRQYDCSLERMEENVQSIKQILLDEWKQMNPDCNPTTNVQDFYQLTRFMIFRLMLHVKLNIKVKVDRHSRHIRKENVKQFLVDNIFQIKDDEFSESIKLIEELKKIITE